MSEELGPWKKGIEKAVENLQRQEQERIIRENKDYLISWSAAVYGGAIAYTNAMILAGYVGVFSVWGVTKDALTKDQTAWVAILLIVSLVGFVVFEVYKMIENYITILRLSPLLKDNGTPEKMQKAIQDFQKGIDIQKNRLLKIWPCVLVFVMVTGFGAAGILLYCFIGTLLA